ncbi:hypothetical protein [Patulibacter defluvii]|uniref:hypothetical protein n=1 Tax=Patulibacter defluvii TaxID=3095358 RepID=UPI002A75903A|nr:hypothetical protein [Patulibacter sp. DM4]
MKNDHDDLLARLRAADPVAGQADPPPARARVRARRAALQRRRGVLAAPIVAAPALAMGTAVVLAVAPAGSPGLDQILDRAAAATDLPANRIVMIRSQIDVRTWHADDGGGELHQDATGWVRLNPAGKPLNVRERTNSASYRGGSGVDSATEYATAGEVKGAVSQDFDPKTGRTTTERNSAIQPRLVFTAHELLEAARRGERDVRLDGEATVDGRRTYRLVIANLDGESAVPGIEDRTELYVDAKTYDAVQYRTVSKGLTSVPGKPRVRFSNETTQRVTEWRELPDTAANRRLLRVGGPLEPAA